MLQFLSCSGYKKVIYLFILILVTAYLLFDCVSQKNILKTETVISYIPSSSLSSSTIHTHDFRLYPFSSSFLEYSRIQIGNAVQSMFTLNKSESNEIIDNFKPIQYSESKFRSASFPIIWLDEYGDVHWNHAAQYETLNYLIEKQFPNHNVSACLSQQLFILEQWSFGFFSRHHCLIEQFGQTLYSPSMVLLAPKRLSISNAGKDDFQNEGILRYYQSLSLCSAHLNHPPLKPLHDILQFIDRGLANTKMIKNIKELLERDELTVKFKFSSKIWEFDYSHVPHRRWLFDRNRKDIKKMINYSSPIQLLINHSDEHIYYYVNSSSKLATWVPRNVPFIVPKEFLPG